MILPASIIFYDVVIETLTKREIEDFIAAYVEPYPDAEIVKKEVVMSDSANYVNLVMFGKPIAPETIESWQTVLTGVSQKTQLRIFQGSDRQALPEVTKLVDMFNRSQIEVASKEDLIKQLKSVINEYEASVLPTGLSQEIQINYPEVAHVKMGRMVHADFQKNTETRNPDFFVYWHPDISEQIITNRMVQLQNWLAVRMPNDSVCVFSMGRLTNEGPFTNP